MISLRILRTTYRILERIPPSRPIIRAYTMAPGTIPIPPVHPTCPLPFAPKLSNLPTNPAPVPLTTQPIVISGPSGVGKGTLYKLLLQRHPSIFATSISHTTREPRPGETRDVDYYYVSMADFEKLIEEGGFVEHAKFGGNRYGTSKSMIEDFIKGGKVVVLDIEMEVRFLFALSAEVKDWECKAYGGEPWDSWECQTEEGLDTLLCCSQPLRA